jgi:hypothetical protein
VGFGSRGFFVRKYCECAVAGGAGDVGALGRGGGDGGDGGEVVVSNFLIDEYEEDWLGFGGGFGFGFDGGL